jgi:hypothetical protein
MSPQLQQVLRDIDQLPPIDRLQVMNHIIDSIREYIPAKSVRLTRKWSDLKGMASAPLMDKDEQ